LKRSPQSVSLLCVLAALAPLALAQEANSGSSQGMSGNLAAARNLRVKLDMGSVVMHGGQQQGISYVVHSHSYSSEKDVRRQSGFKINSYVKGDTAWIVGEWEAGRPHKFSSEVTVSVPRLMMAPPPSAAELPARVQLLTVSVPSL